MVDNQGNQAPSLHRCRPGGLVAISPSRSGSATLSCVCSLVSLCAHACLAFYSLCSVSKEGTKHIFQKKFTLWEVVQVGRIMLTGKRPIFWLLDIVPPLD